MRRPDGLLLDPDDTPGDKDGDKSVKSTSNDEAPTISRMIDREMGLLLSTKDIKRINNAFKKPKDNEGSINQTLGSFRTIPAFVDLELKKKASNRIPEDQLDVWNAGLYLKRKHHKWDTSIPHPAIVVKGHM